jgi:hypothetical protein
MMSAFFVGEATIADAVECMRLYGPTFCKEMVPSIADALWLMNALAMNQRYGEPIDQYKADIAAYSNPDPSDDPFQIIKSAECLLYQCSEGNVPEMGLFKSLEKAIETMTVSLIKPGADINRHASYEAAKWGRD